ncbi:biotin/lipoyl-containing protein, partial [Streptomyces sp. NPDC004050]
MPDVGEGLTEAEILKWYVQPGDTVTDGQVVCEVETAKAAVELPIPFDGTVHALLFEEGTTVDVGQVIISVQTGAASEAPAAPVAAAAPAPAAEAQAPAEEPAPEGRQPVLVGYGVAQSSTKRRPRKAVPAAAGAPAPVVAAAPVAAPAAPAPVAVPAPVLNGNGHAHALGERPLAKPPVRKLAKDLGIDLATVVPTGDGGAAGGEQHVGRGVGASRVGGCAGLTGLTG